MSTPDPSELQPRELLQIAANFFEEQQVNYRVVGSMASIAYGENRFTNDVDMVADLKLEHVDDLCAQFAAPDYFLARHAVEDPDGLSAVSLDDVSLVLNGESPSTYSPKGSI